MFWTVEHYEGWCRQVIHHAAIHAIRARRRQIERIRLCEAPQRLDVVSDANAEAAFYLVEWHIVVAALPISEQRILRLRQEGLTQKEIASTLHVSQQSVSRLYHKAIQDVRQELQLPL